MDSLIQRLNEEEYFARGSAAGGGRRKKGGEEEEFEEDLEKDMVTRTDVNFALYNLGMDQIEGGDYEEAAEAGLTEEMRKRLERKEEAKRKVEEERRKAAQAPEAVEVSSV